MSQATTRDRNFFLFQANPKVWDLAKELKQSDVHEWGVSRLGKDMAPGDLVILWSSGEKRGAYGIARLTSKVQARTKQDELSDKFEECVDLEVVRDWSDAPILAKEIEHFGWMPKSFQGTNFRSTAAAVFGLMEYWHRRDEGVGKRVWKLAPGEDSKYWAAFKEKRMASIGWDIGNLSNIETAEEMEALVKAKYGNGGEGKKPTARTLFAINRRMLPGDYLVAKDGFAGYHGLGVITSEYKYLPYDDDVDCHRVEADWFDVNHHAPSFKQHRQTLIEITERLDELGHIARLYGFDFEGVTGMRPDEGDFFADSFVPAEDVEAILNGLRTKKNVILQGPPGTGKTFIAKRLAYQMMGERDLARIELVQFHQSYSYEDFIQGYRPRSKGGFELRNGVFHRFCDRARRDLDRPYFFIIDEINRGNLSKIFGELMMLIEADKRGEEVQLTYSAEGERFSIPANVHLIGTMNTADRSLAMVDYALRRRFAFFDMPPRFNARFEAHLAAQGVGPDDVRTLVARLQALNKEIRADANLGKGFEIGHSYFCGGVPEGLTAKAWFDEVVEQEVGPQLREFWFDDQAKAAGQIALLKGEKP